MEELKALLPEINEKVEDATEGLKTASTDAMKGSQVSRGCKCVRRVPSTFPGLN